MYVERELSLHSVRWISPVHGIARCDQFPHSQILILVRDEHDKAAIAKQTHRANDHLSKHKGKLL